MKIKTTTITVIKCEQRIHVRKYTCKEEPSLEVLPLTEV